MRSSVSGMMCMVIIYWKLSINERVLFLTYSLYFHIYFLSPFINKTVEFSEENETKITCSENRGENTRKKEEEIHTNKNTSTKRFSTKKLELKREKFMYARQKCIIKKVQRKMKIQENNILIYV